MARKHAVHEGVFESAGKAVDESMALAAALRAGRLTRSQFDAWYAKRTAESNDLIVNLRERTTRLLEPVETAIEQGRRALDAAFVPRSARRSHHAAAERGARHSRRRGRI